MESPWRIWTKIVSVADHVTLFVQIHVVIFIAVKTILIAATSEDEWEGTFSRGITIAIAATAVVAGICMTLVQLNAASLLLDAAQIGKNHGEALENGMKWRNVNLMVFAVIVFGYFLAGSIASIVNTVVFRTVAFYVVYKFTEDLKSFSNFRTGAF